METLINVLVLVFVFLAGYFTNNTRHRIDKAHEMGTKAPIGADNPYRLLQVEHTWWDYGRILADQKRLINFYEQQEITREGKRTTVKSGKVLPAILTSAEGVEFIEPIPEDGHIDYTKGMNSKEGAEG